jgi:glycosyltransferase involved in cell wall biosynthesis
MKAPLVSVVMSVFNGQAFLRDAVDSILNQTMGDFEFLIIDDGSKDDTGTILSNFTRIETQESGLFSRKGEDGHNHLTSG